MPFTLLSDDELIARLLIHTWTLATGKTLRCDVPAAELTEEELIDFWCDDHFDSSLLEIIFDIMIAGASGRATRNIHQDLGTRPSQSSPVVYRRTAKSRHAR
jgi:hypothetical protein